MNAVIFVLCVLLAASGAVPVAENGNGSSFAAGLGAALTNIANSFVVISDDTEQKVNSRIEVEKPPVPHLESANALPSLVHISLDPEEHHIKAKTEELVYTNDTDAQGVVKITIVGEEDISEESTTDTVTLEVEVDDEDDATTTEAFTTVVEDDDGLTTTVEPITTSSLPKVLSTTPAAVLTVLGRDQVDKEKEEEIKENIKEVEAMPVIFTSGV